MFTDLLKSLQNMIEYENDDEIISIHLLCPISAPNFKYQYVREYKQILRSRTET